MNKHRKRPQAQKTRTYGTKTERYSRDMRAPRYNRAEMKRAGEW